MTQHDCRHKGPNGAQSIDDGWLSYCNKDGLWVLVFLFLYFSKLMPFSRILTRPPVRTRMLNVIYDNHGKSGNKFYHAELLISKYHITPEYITTQSLECSKSGVAPDYDPYEHGAKMENMNSPCLINLPICNTEDPAVRKLLKKHTTVYACRRTGQISLP